MTINKNKIGLILLLLLWTFTTIICIVSVVGIIPLVIMYENGWAKTRARIIRKIME